MSNQREEVSNHHAEMSNKPNKLHHSSRLYCLPSLNLLTSNCAEYLVKGVAEIYIHREKPEMLKALPRLLARMHPHNPHYKKMLDMLYRTEAGFAGEIKVDKYLESIDFPQPVQILTDVELSIHPKYSIQIDTLILTPSYAFILEIKNIAGTLTYISNPPHFERTHEDKKTVVIGCPIMQLNNNREGFDMWLKKNDFPIQSTGMIVMANSNTSVKNAPHDMPIIYAKHLPLYFRKMKQEKAHLNRKEYYALIEKLKHAQQRYNPYPLCQKNGIDHSSIHRGFICTSCTTSLVRMNHLTWNCPTCNEKTKHPFAEGLQDWFMLIKNTISNEECRDFFQLKDKYAANYILKSFHLKRQGKSKATEYIWDYKISPSDIMKRKRSTSEF